MATDGHRPGFDAPAEEDLLGRWTLAKTVASIVCSAPGGYSVRVGVHGAWGMGKSSVLRFVRQIAEETDHLVIEFKPSGFTEGSHMWLALASALVRRLEEAGVDVKGAWKTSGVFQKALTAGRKLLKIREETAAVGGAVEPLLSEFFKFTTDELKAATESLGGRRLIILVDDLDRADLKLVPQVLFALRELLDLPGLSWVLAMDPAIVTKALAAHHPGFSAEQGDYLEKIAEFRFWLPRPTPQQIWRVVEHDLTNGSDVALDRMMLRQEIEQLPSNPRGLRGFLRHLSALSPEIRRYASDELDLRLLLFATLLRVRFAKLLDALLSEERCCGRLA